MVGCQGTVYGVADRWSNPMGREFSDVDKYSMRGRVGKYRGADMVGTSVV